MRAYEWIIVVMALAGTIAVSVILSGRPIEIENGESDLSRKISALEEQVNSLRDRLDAELVFDYPADDADDGDRMERALKMLEASDPVAQYRAGRALRGYGDEAIEPLAEIIREGEAGRAHVLVLASISGERAVESIRTLASELLSENGDSGSISMLLGELARRRDEQAAGVFRKGLGADSDSIQLAAVTGIRRLGDVKALNRLVQARKEARSLLVREIDKAVNGLLISDPGKFRDESANLEPQNRFQLVRLLLAHPGREQRRLLSEWAENDPDMRVKAGARRALELIGRQDEATAENVSAREPATDEDVEAIEELLNRLRD